MMEKYYMLFRGNKIYIKSNKSRKIIEYTLNNPTTYPNVPMYYGIFNNDNIIKDLKTFIEKNLNVGSSFMKIVSGKKICLLIPDDVTEVTDIEKRAFDDFARKLFGAKNVLLGSEFPFVAPYEENGYVCISKTCRMMVMTYVKDKHKNVFNQKFIEAKEYTNEEIYNFINELYGGFGSIPKIYFNGLGLSQYSDIGIITDVMDLVNNFENALELAKI